MTKKMLFVLEFILKPARQIVKTKENKSNTVFSSARNSKLLLHWLRRVCLARTSNLNKWRQSSLHWSEINMCANSIRMDVITKSLGRSYSTIPELYLNNGKIFIIIIIIWIQKLFRQLNVASLKIIFPWRSFCFWN